MMNTGIGDHLGLSDRPLVPIEGGDRQATEYCDGALDCFARLWRSSSTVICEHSYGGRVA